VKFHTYFNFGEERRLGQLFSLIERAHRDKSYETEASLLQKILEIKPNDPEIISRLAELYYHKLGDFKNATIWFEKMRKFSRPHPSLFFHLGLCYYHSQVFLKAKENLEKYLKRSQGEKDRDTEKLVKEAGNLLELCKKELTRQKEIKLNLKEERRREERAKSLSQKASFSPEPSSREKESSPLLTPKILDKDYRIKISYLPSEDETIINLLKNPVYDDLASYQLRLSYHHLTLFKEYDELLCLKSLHNVEKYWYQVETVKRVLRQFRGRALLCDEVGLGKTIEAGMLIKEYLLRGMIKRILILTPSSLVSQWRGELLSKFGLDFVTTDDPSFKNSPQDFWKREEIIASINIAKSRNHFELVTGEEYDLVVVDEVHHLKNRRTLNWKLVDSLKKRFILLLSATPVQNNLVELYNLLTLLKPGIFKTESHFKREYVKRGNPRLPSNQEKLRALLREVMIRNKRSLVDVKLPKRFAQTIMVEPSPLEKDIYKRVSDFVRENYDRQEGIVRFNLNLLQMEAGSSPFALRESLLKLMEGRSLNGEGALTSGLAEIIGLIDEVSIIEKGRQLLNLVKKTEDKKIIFARYYKTLSYLSSLLRGEGIPFVEFRGEMTNTQKDHSIAQFRDGVEILLSSESGGEGRNIQFCNTMINYDLPWNPMLIEQRIGRIHRIGQGRDVFIFNFVVKDTVEDYILRILDQKINMFQLVIGEIESILGNLEEEKDFGEIIMGLWVKSSSKEELEENFDVLGERLLEARRGYEKTKELDEVLFSDDYEV